jgi:predicted nucleotidyltransferase
LDIAYLLTAYEAIPEIKDALYESDSVQIMETYGWDITLAAAHLLGKHAKAIAQENTRQEIARLANGELDGLTTERLAEEMCEHVEHQYDRNEQLLTAFFRGFVRNE